MSEINTKYVSSIISMIFTIIVAALFGMMVEKHLTGEYCCIGIIMGYIGGVSIAIIYLLVIFSVHWSLPTHMLCFKVLYWIILNVINVISLYNIIVNMHILSVFVGVILIFSGLVFVDYYDL